jgi:Ca2+-binding RTX toxin-like protein
MTTHTWHGQHQNAWHIDDKSDTWVLAKDGSINITYGNVDNDGIYVHSDAAHSEVDVYGDISVVNFKNDQHAVYIEAPDTTLHIYHSAILSSVEGVVAGGKHGAIINDGTINGQSEGIYADFIDSVVNNGKIIAELGLTTGSVANVENNGLIKTSEVGVSLSSTGDSFKNNKDGLIDSERDGVSVYDAITTRVVNQGSISGIVHSVVDGDGSMTLINQGKLVGDVDLGAGNDIFDGRGGTVTGVVSGGLGDDVYKLSSTDLQISEMDNGGTDKVVSTVSYTLGNAIENLTLSGKAGVEGHGNMLDNVLIGNKGNNHLYGDAGHDLLSGGAGKDVLFGGDDADTFLFRRHAVTDIVGDFQDGSDHLWVDFVHTPDELNDLLANHMHQQGDNVVISYGHDRLVIDQVTMTDITADDFILK